MKNLFFRLASFFAVLSAFSVFAVAPLFANAHTSTQPHVLAVSAVTPPAADGSFFSAGRDGFLIRWTADGKGEHYQVSELEIKMIVLHPNGTDIAIYETDGFTVYRVSVWNWQTLNRKFAKRLAYAVSSLAYTQGGTYLVAGTVSVEGAVFFDAVGTQTRKLTEASGIVSLVKTNASESSSVMYSPTGAILYYDLKTGKKKASFTTQAHLSQPTLFDNDVFLAGVRDISSREKEICVVRATSGEAVAHIPIKNTLLFSSSAPDSKKLYYAEISGSTVTVRSIENQNKWVPALIERFTLTQYDSMTCVAMGESGFICGSVNGHVYTGNTPEKGLAVKRLSTAAFEKILDVASIGNDFFFMTSTQVYKTNFDNLPQDTFDTAALKKIADNTDRHTNIIPHGDSLIFWTKNTRKAIYQLNIATGTRKVLFTPAHRIRSVHLFDSVLLIVEGSASVTAYSFATAKTDVVYTGAGIQDALLYSANELIIAKTTASNPPSPLISVNMGTKETVRLPLDGEVAYALSSSDTAETPVYGIMANVTGGERKTAIFAYLPSTKKTTMILQLADEDSDAFTALFGTVLYTNMGKLQILSYDVNRRQSVPLERGAAFPEKIAQAGARIAVLNSDGSISWHTAAATRLAASWWLLSDGTVSAD